METDRLQELIQKCLTGGNKEDWQELKEKLRQEKNDSLHQEWKCLCELKKEDLKADTEKMWTIISHYRTEGADRIRLTRRLIRYAAVIVIPLMLGGMGWWLNHHTTHEIPETRLTSMTLEPGQTKAILKLNDGQQIDLSAISKDTVLVYKETKVRLDSSHCLSYSAQEPIGQELIYNTILIPRGGEYRLVLADGTIVWLNADSELKYPVYFTSGQRKVFLRGEAYFEVARNEKQPFIVEVEGMDVKVLGTKFNINASRADGIWRTTLVEGKVKVSDHRTAESVILLPDQQAESRSGHLYVKQVDASVSTAWRQGKFYFQSETLEEIAAQLERWYDIQFFFTRESLKKEKFTGVIRRDYSADRILDIITKTTDVYFGIKERTITVY